MACINGPLCAHVDPAINQYFVRQSYGYDCAFACIQTVANCLLPGSLPAISPHHPLFTGARGRGVPLEQMPHAISVLAPRLETRITLAGESTLEAWLQELRHLDSERCLIVNFDRHLGRFPPAGHYSLAVSFDMKTNKVAILDVRLPLEEAYPMDAQVLFKAMRTSDTQTKKSRGWIVVSRKSNEHKAVDE